MPSHGNKRLEQEAEGISEDRGSIRCDGFTADPGDVAHEAETRGFEGIVFPEHTHMPVGHEESPYSGTEERMVQYRRLHSPFIAMAWAASRTTRLSIGTCVSLPAQHDPIILAKTLASLDLLSNGRIVYGFGFGWSEQEMIDHGVDLRRWCERTSTDLRPMSRA